MERLGLEIIPDIVTVDVSFISILLIVKSLYSMMGSESDMVALIKPQFELDRPYSGFRGVVRSRERHLQVLRNLHGSLISTGYRVWGSTFSPIKGPKGNIEYFMHLKINSPGNEPAVDLQKVVDDSYIFFNEGGEKHD
jgi:23S rRNA (cytidine1920-2'-O)/16S rRNA (cytidine1409-2'-O)-methyltransferase